MALIVCVYVNDRLIINTYATRVKGQPHELCTYRLPDGKLIEHHYDKGGAELAIRALQELNKP